MKHLCMVLIAVIFMTSCNTKNGSQMENLEKITLMVLDPAHFHASLVQKTMYPGIDSNVYVYSPGGFGLDDYLGRITDYNTRADDPTRWNLHIYRGDDFLEKMLAEKPGNLVVMAGNNRNKTEYIKACIDAGLNVYADKPMAITPADYDLLMEAFQEAGEKGLLLYDIMTERYEITTILQKKLSLEENIFGDIIEGTQEIPAITKESVHHFSKVVSGKPLQRPDWFFDITQQGEAIADVGTHLVDLVMWEAFPGGVSLQKDTIELLDSRRWETKLTPTQFKKVTGEETFPGFLSPYVKNNLLQVPANSALDFSINGVHCKVSVAWHFEAPEGGGDTHYSIMRGTIANLVIRQGAEQNYKPELYIEVIEKDHADRLEMNLVKYFSEVLEKEYPGIALEGLDAGVWQVSIPAKYREGHEAHFARVTEKLLDFYGDGAIPEDEVTQMVTKYYITTSATRQ